MRSALTRLAVSLPGDVERRLASVAGPRVRFYSGLMRTDVDPRLIDGGIALATALVLAVVIAADPTGGSPAAYAFAIGFGAVLLARRRLARTVLGATILATFVYYILDLPPVGMVLPSVGALFSVAEKGRTPTAIGGAAVLLSVAIFFRLTGDDADLGLTGYTFVTELALAAAAIALGSAVRWARESRERSEEVARLSIAEEQHRADARAQQERLRIARDLHDTIGHSLSVATLHAGVAAESENRDSARVSIDHARRATSDALRELRRTVRLLRDTNAAEAAPLPSLERAHELFSGARGAGLTVREHLVVPEALDAAVDAAAFRVLQESLTNVLRHAHASTVEIDVSARAGRLDVRVSDDGGPAIEGPLREGTGIHGMRERVAILGGTLEVTHEPRGVVVAASLPLPRTEKA